MFSDSERQQQIEGQGESETDGLIGGGGGGGGQEQQNNGWTIQTATAGKRKTGGKKRTFCQKRDAAYY